MNHLLYNDEDANIYSKITLVVYSLYSSFFLKNFTYPDPMYEMSCSEGLEIGGIR